MFHILGLFESEWKGNENTEIVNVSFSDKNDDWQQAETLMSNYKTMLERRDELQSTVRTLEQQNETLEDELKTRLNDKVNEELAYPPSAMITVGGEGKR